MQRLAIILIVMSFVPWGVLFYLLQDPKDIDALHSRIAELEAQGQLLVREIERNPDEAQVRELEAQLAGQSAELAATTARLEALTADKETLERSRDELQEDVIALRERISAQIGQRAEIEAERDRLSAALLARRDRETGGGNRRPAGELPSSATPGGWIIPPGQR